MFLAPKARLRLVDWLGFASRAFCLLLEESACEAMLASDMCSCYAVEFAAKSSSEVPEKFKFEFTPNEFGPIFLDS